MKLVENLPGQILCHYWQMRAFCHRTHEQYHIRMADSFHNSNLEAIWVRSDFDFYLDVKSWKFDANKNVNWPLWGILSAELRQHPDP